jgi:hypothetical protein
MMPDRSAVRVGSPHVGPVPNGDFGWNREISPVAPRRERVCFVHVGAPKTGSTAIQHFLVNNAAALASAGSHYPIAGRCSWRLAVIFNRDEVIVRGYRHGQQRSWLICDFLRVLGLDQIIDENFASWPEQDANPRLTTGDVLRRVAARDLFMRGNESFTVRGPHKE